MKINVLQTSRERIVPSWSFDALSIDRGETSPPLIEQTISRFFDTIAERHPDNEALVSRHRNLRGLDPLS